MFKGNLYVYLESNCDFTDNKEVILNIKSDTHEVKLNILVEENAKIVYSLFKTLPKEDKPLVLAWNIKEIFCVLRHISKYNFHSNILVIDLNIVSEMVGNNIKKPISFKEAFVCLKKCGFENVQQEYKLFYWKLISRVLVDMEIQPVTDRNQQKMVYSHYEILNQVNGRLKTTKTLKDCYLPHNMSQEYKKGIHAGMPQGYFLQFDYKGMEVCTAAWISGDQNLKELISGKDDIYEAIWKRITKGGCNASQRDLCKKIFLPVLYGMGPKSLSGLNPKLNEEISSQLINRIRELFPALFSWIESDLDSDEVKDCFGKIRSFDVKDKYKIRNFKVQSPAAHICLSKLIELHENLPNNSKLNMNIHDSYLILCERRFWSSIAFEVKEILERNTMFNGLQLLVDCRIGECLGNLQTMKLTKRDKMSC